MNKKPVWYLQTDTRWKNVRFPCNGGSMSIGGGGCGPTSAAMLIETLTGKQCLPTEAMKWACDHGYVYANQGTSYDYFRPQFLAHDIDCEILTRTACLSVSSWIRERVLEKLRDGYYFIALMKKGLWTNGGHYVVVWWADDKIRINDPASTKDARLNGDPDTFFRRRNTSGGWTPEPSICKKAKPPEIAGLRKRMRIKIQKRRTKWRSDIIRSMKSERRCPGRRRQSRR